MILFTLELMEIYKYFLRYPKDAWFNKVSVLVALSSDFTTVFTCLLANYLYLVTEPHRTFSTSKPLHVGHETGVPMHTRPWCVAVYIVSTSISSGVVQLWLARMVYGLTKQFIWLPIISLFIACGLTGAAATADLLVMDLSYTAHPRLINLIRRLSVAAIRNGSITTVMMIITLVIFTLQPQTNYDHRPSVYAVSPFWFSFRAPTNQSITRSMLSNLNNHSVLLGESQGSSNKKTTEDPNATSDADAIQMGDLQFSMQKGRDIGSDGNSDIDLVVKVQNPDGMYDNGL
ncbi:hypothetical protein C8R44DRAFT_730724 [Mycena epipterygia]|nr:hypothetical protein C8R44DRAFT_730724 [Mycena epipterygia]